MPDSFWQVLGQKSIHLVIHDISSSSAVHRANDLIHAVLLIAVFVESLTSMAGVEEYEGIVWLRVLQQPLNSYK